ncbi:MAG: hypothetical protein AAGB29_00500 [Planctomycetota bacterium]
MGNRSNPNGSYRVTGDVTQVTKNDGVKITIGPIDFKGKGTLRGSVVRFNGDFEDDSGLQDYDAPSKIELKREPGEGKAKQTDKLVMRLKDNGLNFKFRDPTSKNTWKQSRNGRWVSTTRAKTTGTTEGGFDASIDLDLRFASN